MSQLTAPPTDAISLLTGTETWTPPSTLWRYGVAIVSVAVVLVISLVLQPVFAASPYFLFVVAVAISAAYGGWFPGAVAAIISTLSVNLFLLPHTLLAFGLDDLLRTISFLAAALVIGWLYDRRRQAEETLRQQREWFQVTLASIGDATIATDTSGCVTFMNGAAAALTGWQMREALGKPIHQVFHIVNEHSRHPVENPVEQVLKEGRIVGLANHTVLIAKDGREYAIDDSGAPIRDRQGHLIGAVLVFRDVSDQRDSVRKIEDARTQLVETLESISDAFYALDQNWCFTYVNQKAAETWGKPASYYLGKNIWEEFSSGIGTEAYQQFHRAFTERESVRFETYSAYLDEWVSVQAYPGSSGGLVVYFRDITNRKQREERLRSLYELAGQLSSAVTLPEVAKTITQTGLSALHASAATVSLLDETAATLEVICATGMTPEALEKWRQFPLTMPWPVNEVVRTGQPLWFETQTERLTAYPATAEFASNPGAWAVMPLLVKGQTFGAITIVFERNRPFSVEDRAFLLSLSDQCAQALDRARLYEKELEARQHAEAAQKRLAFLAEASAQLGKSLNYEITLSSIANLALPLLADLCGIDLLYDDQSVQRLVLTHREPAQADLIHQLSARYPIDLQAQYGSGHVIRTGDTEHVEALTPELLETAIPDPEQRRQTELLNLTSYINTPLFARNRTIGALYLAYTGTSNRHYTAADVALVKELAQRIAAAIDNARLYRELLEQRTLAEALRDSGMALTSSLELENVLDQIRNNLSQVIPHEAANIMMIRDQQAHIVRSYGYTEHGLGHFIEAITVLPLTPEITPLLCRMIETRQPVLMRNGTLYLEQYPAAAKPEMEKIGSSLGAPILAADEVIGFINLSSLQPAFFTSVHARHLQTFANQAAVAIQNAQLYEQAQELAVLEERQRLARDLHDAVSQTLFSASVITESLPRLLERKPETLVDRLHQLNRLTRGAMAEMRTLLLELRPAMLTNSSLNELLVQLVEAIKGRKSIAFSLTIAEIPALPEETHVALYRITQEALNNVVKHSQATEVTLQLRDTGTHLELTISDNGVGFDTDDSRSGFGMSTMRERAEAIGAQLSLNSQKGSGTQITVTWEKPVEKVP